MVATLSTACGDSGSSAQVEKDTTATTEAKAPSTTAVVSPYDESDLTAMLLTAAEMGSGWTVTTSDPDEDQLSCVADLEDDGTLDSTKAEVQFDYGNGLAFVLEGTRWAGEDPQTTYEALVDAIDGCDTASVSGSTEIQSIEPISYPAVADDVSAWEVTFTSDGQTITAQMIIALQDDILIQVMGAYPTQVMTADESQPIVEGAAQKVASLS